MPDLNLLLGLGHLLVAFILIWTPVFRILVAILSGLSVLILPDIVVRTSTRIGPQRWVRVRRIGLLRRVRWQRPSSTSQGSPNCHRSRMRRANNKPINAFMAIAWSMLQSGLPMTAFWMRKPQRTVSNLQMPRPSRLPVQRVPNR